MKRAMTLPALALLAALMLLPGCGAGTTGGAAAAAVHTSTVDLPPSYRFDPAVITVPAGTTVTWTNHDNFTHSVKFDGGADTNVHIMRPGESASITFATPGEYPYVCTFHSQNMKGKVIVTAGQ
ncbi:MAG TPA: cupredoxin domain-containing protein [Thermomicrobiales bacterium]|nr:cupredoxin domain-containing protein [Thermomicrobiales bacterium]